jgi:hypothetical protein
MPVPACASHGRFFRGLRLHLVCTLQGLPISFALTGAKAGERETLLGLLAAGCELLRQRPRQTLTGDKNYFGRGFERELPGHRVRLLRPARKGERERARRSAVQAAATGHRIDQRDLQGKA